MPASTAIARLIFACLLAGCESRGDEHAAQPPAAATREALPPSAPPAPAPDAPHGASPHEPPPPPHELPPPVAADELAAILPDVLGDYRATGPARPETTRLADGNTTPQAKRTYLRGGSTLVLEIMDAVQAGTVLRVVQLAQKKDRWTPDHITRGMEINGHWVITQWSGKQQSARIGALLGGRLIYNLSVTPAATIEPAIAMAQQMDYDSALALLGEAR